MGNQTQAEPTVRLQVNIYPHEYFERIEGQELERNPHRSIVAIQGRTDQGLPFFGSGVLLSKDMVLTAAHNIYYHSQKKPNNKFKVYHKPQGVTTKYHEVQSWKYLSLFKAPNLQIKFDYALIKLKPDQKLSIDYNGFPKLLVTCSKCFQKTQQLKIGIFGYPKELNQVPYETQNFKPQPEGGISIFQYGFQLKNRVQLIDHNNFVIKYKINTKGGQSGCPITMGQEIIGIHNGGNEKEKVNLGRLITAEMASNIQMWSKQLKGDPFIIKYNGKCCKEQENNIQIKQAFIYQITAKLQNIPVQEKKRIISLTLKATVTIQQKKRIINNTKDVISKL